MIKYKMILKYAFVFILITQVLFAKVFTVASYNVENLFDLKYNGSEYKEYIPNTSSLWNKKNYLIKLQNISRVINDLNADVLVLQEIESLNVLLSLKRKTHYKYHSFIKQKESAVGLAVLSKYKILRSNTIAVRSKKIKRDILEVDIKIENKIIKIFNNHWPSKRQKESFRILYANTLNNYIKKFQEDLDYILIGDFNSNYNEKETLKLNKDLNDSYNITGINDILNSSSKILTKEKKNYHYNLWYELNYTKRFSSLYRNNKITPDNILLAQALFDKKNISYINNSFKALSPPYLYSNRKIHRWKMTQKYGVHAGEGYSDHLAIIASFETQAYKKKENRNKGIAALYKSNNSNIKIYNVVVIYKDKNNYIIKQKNKRAIYIYKSKEKLEVKASYNLEILQTKEHYGLKEISSFKIIKKHSKEENIKEYFTQANTIDLFDSKNQNELIINLSGQYKKGYLHYIKNNKKYKIKLYSKDKTLLPKNGQKINIIQAHLSFFKNKAQIIINKKSEYYAY